MSNDIKAEANRAFLENFTSYDRHTIDDEGLITVHGSTKLSEKYRGDHLPCRFREVTGHFEIGFTPLKTLLGSPQQVGLKFFAPNCRLETLEGAPRRCGEFWVLGNQLTSLQGGPEHVDGNYLCHSNPLETLEGLANDIGGQFRCDITPNLGMLRVLMSNAADVYDLALIGRPPLTIINKWLPKGKAGLSACATELIKAGYRGNARL